MWSGEQSTTAAGAAVLLALRVMAEVPESRTGTTIGWSASCRRFAGAHFRPLPRDVAAGRPVALLDLIEGGGRVVYDPSAATQRGSARRAGRVGTAQPAAVVRACWTCCGGVAACCGGGAPAGQLWATGGALLRGARSPTCSCSSSASGRCNLSALAHCSPRATCRLVELVRWLRGGRRSFKPARLIAQVRFLQGVGLGGLVRYLRGDRPALCPKSSGRRTLSPAQPSPNS